MDIGDQAFGVYFTGNGPKIYEGKIVSKFLGDFRIKTEVGLLGTRPERAFETRGAAEVFLVLNS